MGVVRWGEISSQNGNTDRRFPLGACRCRPSLILGDFSLGFFSGIFPDNHWSGWDQPADTYSLQEANYSSFHGRSWPFLVAKLFRSATGHFGSLPAPSRPLRILTTGALLLIFGTILSLPFRLNHSDQDFLPDPVEATGPTQSSIDARHLDMLVDHQAIGPAEVQAFELSPQPTWTPPPEPEPAPQVPRSYDEVAVQVSDLPIDTGKFSASLSAQQQKSKKAAEQLQHADQVFQAARPIVDDVKVVKRKRAMGKSSIDRVAKSDKRPSRVKAKSNLDATQTPKQASTQQVVTYGSSFANIDKHSVAKNDTPATKSVDKRKVATFASTGSQNEGDQWVEDSSERLPKPNDNRERHWIRQPE